MKKSQKIWSKIAMFIQTDLTVFSVECRPNKSIFYQITVFTTFHFEAVIFMASNNKEALYGESMKLLGNHQ